MTLLYLKVEKLDKHWKEWTGLRILLKELDKEYLIKRVHCIKGSSQVRQLFKSQIEVLVKYLFLHFFQKPDLFKYAIFIEIAGESDLFARDCLQKFRIRRMSGYVALYKRMDMEKLEMAQKSSDSLEAMAYHLNQD